MIRSPAAGLKRAIPMELDQDENDAIGNARTKDDAQEELPKTAINMSLKKIKNGTKNQMKHRKTTKVVEMVESDQEIEAN